MNELATVLRAAQFYAHAAHNLTSGFTFHEDHEYFGELYGAYESAYDGVIERMIGFGTEPDINAITLAAAKDIQNYKHDTPEHCYEELMDYEKQICDLVVKFNGEASLGTQNFLQGLADDSEMRQYKIGQRLK